MRFVRKWEGNYHYGYTDADAFTIAGQAILQKRAIFEIIKDSPFLQKKLLQVQECDGWRRCPELNTGIRGLQAPRLSAWLHRHK